MEKESKRERRKKKERNGDRKREFSQIEKIKLSKKDDGATNTKDKSEHKGDTKAEYEMGEEDARIMEN